jgi:hypothetical protein
MAMAMAGLMYSKYHGALVIVFVVLSNLRLLTNWKFWLAGIVAILALMPHILWQIQHEFPSLQYHLISRARQVEPKHVLSFIPNQLLNFNPFFIGVMVYLLVKHKARDLFEKALYSLSIGFITFFFLATFRGHVEPHWTIGASIGMIVLLYRKSMENAGIRKYVYRILIPSIGLLLFARVVLMVDFLPLKGQFHGGKEWCQHMASIAGPSPVVFRNTYQRPSMYTFYTGHPTTALNNIYYHKTQFELWDFQSQFYGKKAVLLTGPDQRGDEPPAGIRCDEPSGPQHRVERRVAHGHQPDRQGHDRDHGGGDQHQVERPEAGGLHPGAEVRQLRLGRDADHGGEKGDPADAGHPGQRTGNPEHGALGDVRHRRRGGGQPASHRPSAPRRGRGRGR